MKLPSGYIFLLKPDRKGKAVTIEEKELILCGDCKYYCEEKKGRDSANGYLKPTKQKRIFAARPKNKGANAMNSIAVVEWLKFLRNKLFIDHEDILSEPEKEALNYAIFILEQQNRKLENTRG